MSGIEFVLGTLVVVLVLGYVALPLLRRQRAPDPALRVQDGTVEERATIYRELLELELDQKVGKIDEADFREQSDTLLARAATLISRDDTRGTASDDQIEQEIADMRATLRAPESAARSEPRA